MTAEYLEVTSHGDRDVIVVLRTCSIRWSTDTTLWHDMGFFTEHAELRVDTGGTLRSYMAVDGQVRRTYFHHAAALAFTDLMEPWFPNGGTPTKEET